MGITAYPRNDSGQPPGGQCPKADWDKLWARHSQGLYHRVLGMVRNPADAEDALQEGLLSAFRNLPRFEGRSGISTWLTRIVINSALMQLRSRRTRGAVALNESLNGTAAAMVTGMVDSNPNPEQLCLMRERRRVLARSIGGLSPDMQAAVTLRYMQGLSTREAAQSCGVSENTLKARLRRARRRLASSNSLLALL